MNTKGSVLFSMIAIVAAVLLAASHVIASREAIAATAATVVNPPTTIVNSCPLGTIPETTTTGTVCLLIPSGGYGYGIGLGPHYWYHPWHHVY